MEEFVIFKNKITVLNLEQIKLGRQKTLHNAKLLVKEAEVILSTKNYPRVVFLSHIAGEEIAKYIMLTSLMVKIIAGKKINWKKFWKRFYSHKEKLELGLFMEDLYFGKNISDDLKKYFENLKMQSRKLDYFKQICLYSDFFGDLAISPNEFISKKLAEDALGWVKGRLKLFTTMEKEFERNKVLGKLNKEIIEKYMGKFLQNRVEKSR